MQAIVRGKLFTHSKVRRVYITRRR